MTSAKDFIKNAAFYVAFWSIRAIYAFNERLTFASQTSVPVSRVERRRRL